MYAPDRPYNARRGMVMAENGAVATAHPLATATGLQTLQDGGNFMDAAIATAAVLNVVEPYNSNLGGDVFMIVYDAKTGHSTALNGSGNAAMAVSPEVLPEGIPDRGMAAATVPGQVDGWITALEHWGTRSLEQLLGPAIAYAEDGFYVNFNLSHSIHGSREMLGGFPTSKALFLTNGKAPGPGERWCNRDMAKTMRMLAKGGRESFYQGEIAEAIAFFAQNNGGFLSVEDMANHQTQLIEPIRTTYRGHEVLGQPPASQGLIMLEELNILEGFPISEWGHLSADSLHHSIEAKKLAFADRIAYIGDPNSTDNPLDALLSKDFANTRAKEIDPEKASSSAKAGELPNHDTTYFCVMDGEGNAVSFIQSIFAEFGAGCVVEGTGMLMNNRMNGFYLDPDSPNVLAPGKKPIHTLNAYMLIKDGKPSLVCGTPGGDVQVQTNLQIIEAVVDHGITLQEAIEAPRWNHGGDIVALEDRVPDDTVAELERRGHRAKSSGAWGGSGHVQGVMIHSDNGAMMIGSDPRCDGCGLGW